MRASRSEYLRNWRERNKDKVAAYAEANRERRNANWRARSGAWKEQRAATKAAWHERNRDDVLARKKAHRDDHPSWNLTADAKRRGRKRGTFVAKIDLAAVLAASQGRCGICGQPLSDKIHFDHIVPIARGGSHTQDNLQAAHPKCNLRKGAKAA
jgi:5-methylcytosine-specific restriction endonuclease McrA